MTSRKGAPDANSENPAPRFPVSGDDGFLVRAYAACLHRHGVSVELIGFVGPIGAQPDAESSAHVSMVMNWPTFRDFIVFGVGVIAQHEAQHGAIPASHVSQVGPSSSLVS